MKFEFLDEQAETAITTVFDLKGLFAGWHPSVSSETSKMQSFFVDYIWIVDVRDIYRRGFTLVGVTGEYEHSKPRLNRSLLSMPPFHQSSEKKFAAPESLHLVDLGNPDPIAEALGCVPLINQRDYAMWIMN